MRPALPLAVRLAPALLAALLAGCEVEVADLPQSLKVLRSQPANGESGVSPDVVLRVEFDDAVDPLSLTSTTLLLEPAVEGGLLAEGAFLTFTPYSSLAPDTQYLVEVDGSLKGKKGGTLGGKHGFRFTTRGTNSDILPPAPITDLAATVKGGTTVELVWSASGDDGITGTATRYDLRWATGTGCPLKPENFEAGTSLPLPSPRPAGTDESTTVPNLPRKAFVCFAIKAVDEAGNASGLSNAVALTLPDLVPPNPLLVSLATASENAADLTWKAVGDDADEGLASDYMLYRHAAATCEGLTPTTVQLDGGAFAATELPFPGLAGSTELYSAAGLTRDSDYCFLLRVRDAAGNAAWSNVLPVHTPDLTSPSRPVLAVTTALPTAIALEWTAVGDDGMTGTVTREEVEYAEGACPPAAASFTPTASLPTLPVPGGSSMGAQVSGLRPDTDHCLRVAVEDNVGLSAKSNLVESHTRDLVSPATPILSVSNVGTSSADVSWVTEGDNDSDGQALEEEVRTARGAGCDTLGPGSFMQGDLVLQQTPPAPGTPQTLSLGGLAADEDYCVILRVKDEAGLFATSEVVRFKTVDVVPPAEPQLSILDGGVGATRVTVEWTAVGDNGLQGNADAQSLAFAEGPDCAAFGTDAGVAGTAVTLASPRPPLSAEFADALGLEEDTAYCFQLSVQDEAGNRVRSAVVHATTKDETPPAAPVLSAQTLATGVRFQWSAVCENANHPSCGAPGYGTAAQYQFVHRRAAPDGTCPVVPAGLGQQMMLRGKCTEACGAGQVCAADATGIPDCLQPATGCTGCDPVYEACVASAAGGSTCAARLLQQPVDMAAPGTLHEVTLDPLPPGSLWCAQVLVLDEAGNRAFSNEARNDRPVGLDDLTPPAAVSDLSARRVHGADSVDLTWKAPGDDGSTGTASAYTLYMATGTGCVEPGQGDGFPANASTLTVNVPPLPAGSAQSDNVFVQGLDSLQEPVCFKLRAQDDASPPNTSALSNLAFPPRPISDLAASTDATTGDVLLAWTASGAYDGSGQAARYGLHVRTVASAGACPTSPAAALALPSGLTPAFNTSGPSAAGAPETGSIGGISPGTSLCLVLEAFNLGGDSALSNVAALTVEDNTPPADFTLQLSTVTSTSATFAFTFTGDDGNSGAAARYQVGVVEVPRGATPCACSPSAGVSCGGGTYCIGSQCEDLFAAPLEVLPVTGAVTVTELNPQTHHCAAMRAFDDEGNAGHTPAVSFETDPAGSGGDVDPPAIPVLAAFSPGDVRSTSTALPEADLEWTAVAEDSADPTSAAATLYDVAYRTSGADGTTAVGGQADCDGLNALGAAALQAASAVSLTVVGTPQPGDTLTATAAFTGVNAEQPLCAALKATDGAGNSALSAWRYVRDNTAPGQLANFRVTATGRDNVTLTVDATGDDGSDGLASAYDLRVRAEACPGLPGDFDTTGLAPLPGTPAPGTSTFPDTLAVTGLSPGTTYCFHLVARDDVGLEGPPVTVEVTLPSGAAFDLQAVRNAVASSQTLSISAGNPALAVSAATVTYLKPDLQAGRTGAPPLDTLPGFFLQGAEQGPAIFVQLDPATAASGGLQVGDRVDLSDLAARLMAPDGTTDLQGLVVITNATVARKPACVPPAQGQADPCGPGFTCTAGACLVAAQDATNLAPGEDLSGLEHELVETALLVTGSGIPSNGFVTFPARTGANATFPLKVTDEVAASTQLQPGMVVGVRAPLWRQGAVFEFAAWREADLAVPAAFRLTSPLEGTVDVPLSFSPLTLVLNRPPVAGALATASSVTGPCGDAVNENTVWLSANRFSDCVGVTVSVTAGHAGDARSLTLTPASPLEPGKRYQVLLPAALTGDIVPVESRLGFVTVPSSTCTPRPLVISQVLTANGGAFTNDFVEVHNRSGEPWSPAAPADELQVAVADPAGAEWHFLPLVPVLQSFGLGALPGGAFLSVQVPQEADLPPTGALVALVRPDADNDGVSNLDEAAAGTDPFDPASGAQMGDSCPGPATALDAVALGTSVRAGCGGGEAAPVPLPGESLKRRAAGCIDQGDNASDFDPAPAVEARQPLGEAASCYCTGDSAPDVTDTGAVAEVEYCNVQFREPVGSARPAGESTNVYGRIWVSGVTSNPGEDPALRAELGLAPAGTPLQAWSFRKADFNVQVSGSEDDEYRATFNLPNLPGLTLRYVYRFSKDNGAHWTYCDEDGSGSNAGLTFSLSAAGSVTVTAPP